MALPSLVPLVLLLAHWDVGERRDPLDEWRHPHRKRCDMFSSAFRGPNGAPAYTEGEWVYSTDDRKGITTVIPMECIDQPTTCPIDRCWDSGQAEPSGYCEAFHSSCYRHRQSSTFAQNLRNNMYTWRPSNGCEISPLTLMPPGMWREWATGLESTAGPILFVGDTLMAELFLAFKALTSGATHSKYVRADVLVNTHTLAPMTVAQLDSCLSDSTPPVPNTALRDPPCPPKGRLNVVEDNRWHQIDNLLWPKTLLEESERPDKYKTLVLGTGHQLWKMHAFPAMVEDCRTQGGVADAYQRLTDLPYNLPEWSGCDVFSVRYPVMVQNIARFLANLRVGSHYFNGHVIFVTTPPHAHNCAQMTSPNQIPPSPTQLDVTREEHYWQQVRYAETVWYSAFQKWAPRLKLSVLNITHLSEKRPDARVPASDAANGDNYGCSHFCYPGVPHVWAEMLLRLLEQHHHHV